MINIEPLSNEGRDCYEDILVSVARTYSNNDALMFCYAWSTDYTMAKGTDTIGSRIQTNWGNLGEYLYKYVGIKVEEELVESPERAYQIICNTLQKEKVAAFTIKLKNCYWHDFSNSDIVHTVISCGVEGNEILCVDCKPVKKNIPLKKEDFFKGYQGKLLIFSIVEKSVEYSELIDVMRKQLTLLQTSDQYETSFEAIRAFGRDLEQVDINNECKYCSDIEIWKSPLMNGLNNISIGRKQYARFLEKISEITKEQEFKLISKRLQECSRNYAKARSILIKSIIIGGSVQLTQMASRIVNETSFIEEQMAAKLNYLL